MGQTITNITTKVRVDSMKNAYGVMDGATDYVSADSNKFFHVVILASFAPDFNGTNYKTSSEEADYINVKLYLNNETVVTKDFAIRGMFS